MSLDTLAQWVAAVDAVYPERHAAGWDATGLQVGDPTDVVRAVLVCLDVTPSTLDEAERVGADLVLAHHPLLFRALERLTPDTAAGALALRAARAGIGVLAAHTNLDVEPDGTSAPMVDALDLADVRPLVPLPEPGGAPHKLVTFVPHEATTAVLAALSDAGAGVIGEYDRCSYRVTGTGTFRPSPAANPTLGARGQVNEVGEHRLEVVVPARRLDAAVAALQRAHPYEEVAHDVYELVDRRSPHLGHGRVGTLPSPLPLRAVADRLAEVLPAPHLRVAGDLDQPVRRVAACGGAGDGLLDAARRAGADVYVTGDLRHHPTLDALTLGLAVIDAGHFATEAPALARFRERLGVAARDRGLRARLLPSEVRTEPWAQYRPPSPVTDAGPGPVPEHTEGTST